MKIVQIIILSLISFSLQSQEVNKFDISKSNINVKELLIKEYGIEVAEKIEKIQSPNSYISYGILEFDNTYDDEVNLGLGKIPGSCQCHMMNGVLEISNSVGFMSGIANSIVINLNDSTYYSRIHYNTDGVKYHKFKIEDEFVVDIKVPLKESKLIISADSNFSHEGIIRGKLLGTSIEYYEQNSSEAGHKKIQIELRSIFECRLQDYGKY